jgi:Trk K+ transport system NAD-binding subunit
MKIAVLGGGHMGEWIIKMLSQDYKLCVLDTDRSRTEQIRSAEVISGYSRPILLLFLLPQLWFLPPV